MEIYLVRHGETGGNVARRHQAEDTQLSFKGVQQAKDVADVIKDCKPTHLVTSNLVRALETAQVIGEVCDLVPDTSRHFIELVRPVHLYGNHHRSFKSIFFYMQWYLGIGAGKENKGESYKELRERFIIAEEFLAQYPNDARVVVVSHAVFINLFIAHLCRNKRALNPFKVVLVFKEILSMPNAHVTKLHFDTKENTGICAWSASK